jgi:plasmid stabilization system protein ParE
MLDEPFEVVWTDRAAMCLEQAHQYIASENPSAADRLVAERHSRVAQLSTFPGLGIKCRVRKMRGEIREIVVGKYRAFYQVDEESRRILMLLVWHSSRRKPKADDF